MHKLYFCHTALTQISKYWGASSALVRNTPNFSHGIICEGKLFPFGLCGTANINIWAHPLGSNICIFVFFTINFAFLAAYGLSLALEQFQLSARLLLLEIFSKIGKIAAGKGGTWNTTGGFFAPYASFCTSFLFSAPYFLVLSASEVFCLTVVNQEAVRTSVECRMSLWVTSCSPWDLFSFRTVSFASLSACCLCLILEFSLLARCFAASSLLMFS